MSEETAINDYAADAEIAAPKKRGRPPKVEEVDAPATATVIAESVPLLTPVPEPEPEPEPQISAATRLEMEVGRKIIEGYK
jgi:hypothetical protein